MEVKEIISFYINTSNEVLEVDFRLIEDDDNSVRTDEIELIELTSFGLQINHEDTHLSDEDDFEDMDGLDEDFQDDLTMEEVLSFLNEYYIVNPNRLPDPSLF